LKNKKTRGQTYTLFGRDKKEEREKNNHWWQTDHHPPSRDTPRGRGHGDASKDTIKGQVWPSGGVACAVQKLWTPLMH
jgi:hypothetical protein